MLLFNGWIYSQNKRIFMCAKIMFIMIFHVIRISNYCTSYTNYTPWNKKYDILLVTSMISLKRNICNCAQKYPHAFGMWAKKIP